MYYWMLDDGTAVQSITTDTNLQAHHKITKEEFDHFVDTLNPEPEPPPRDILAEIDEIRDFIKLPRHH